MHPIMYGVMTGVDDPRLDGKSSGLSSLPASRNDEPARAAVASRVITPTKRRRDGCESHRTLEKCHRRAFRVRFARQVARERSRSRIERRNIQLVQLVSLRVLHTDGVAKSTRLHLRLVYRERSAVFRFVGCIGRGHPARRACDARFDA